MSNLVWEGRQDRLGEDRRGISMAILSRKAQWARHCAGRSPTTRWDQRAQTGLAAHHLLAMGEGVEAIHHPCLDEEDIRREEA